MPPVYKNVMITADIEGSSGCFSYEGSRFLTREWAEACVAMSLDVDAAVRGLFDAGAQSVRVQDFHRTAHNLLPELIDPRAEVVHGYKLGPAPGFGRPDGVEAVLFVGLHAASGTTGFLAHTLTSRLSAMESNGRALTEAELFSASLAPWGVRPVFFSGRPLACLQAEAALPGIMTYDLDKNGGPEGFDAARWRNGLSEAVGRALYNDRTTPHRPPGPFEVTVGFAGGEEAAGRAARRWGLPRNGDRVTVRAEDAAELYGRLLNLAYVSPLASKILPVGMKIYNLRGRLGLAWVRRTAADSIRAARRGR